MSTGFRTIKRIYSAHQVRVNLFIVFLFLLIMYQHRYGLGMLNPTNDGWLMKHDWAQHYLGWFFFRNEPWGFPIGKLSNFLYPIGSNVGFTDTIPLAAIFFKVFSPLLPDHFQYIGGWLLMCHVLLAFFTIKVLERFSVRGLAQLVCTLIVVFNPVLLHRAIHPALCSHWLIMGSIWIYFMDTKKNSPVRLLVYQGLFLLIGGMINPYFSLIEAGFLVALAWRLWKFDRSISFLKASIVSGAAFLALFAAWYAIGFFEFSNQTDLGVTGGYGLYAFNLNSLYNSGGWATLTPTYPFVSWHQYESFMYLGAGMMGLIVFALTGTGIVRLWKGPSTEARLLTQSLVPLLCFVTAISLFAITHIVTWNDQILFQITMPAKLLKIADIFRASARYFWVAYYLLFLTGLVLAIRLIRQPIIVVPVLIVVFWIQLYDYRNLLGTEHIDVYKAYHPPLLEARWRKIFQRMDRVVFYPPFEATNLTDTDYRYFCYLAADYHKPISLGYPARSDIKSMSAYVEKLKRNIDDGNIDSGTLYISTPNFAGRFAALYQSGLLGCGQLDGYYFFYSKSLEDDPALADFKKSIPKSMNEKFAFTPFTQAKGDVEAEIQLKFYNWKDPRGIFSFGDGSQMIIPTATHRMLFC